MRPFVRLTLPLLVLSGSGYAQFESALLSKLQVNLVNPGGKSLAMGGAFVSLANDSTAAIANPAGLPQIKSWQAGLSGKSFSFEPTVESSNFFRASASSAWGPAPSNDAYDFNTRTSELEFASIVGPVGKNLTIALYRAVDIRYRQDTFNDGNTNFAYANFNTANTLDSFREQGQIDLRDDVYGISIGGQWGRVAIGAGVTLHRLGFDLSGGDAGGDYKIISETIRNGVLAASETRLAASVDSGVRPGFIAGAKIDLWEEHRVALGAVYRYSPTFDISYTRRTSSATVSCNTDPSLCGTFKVPTDFSVGISGRPVRGLVAAIEVQRVLYSQINSGFVPVLPVCSATGTPCPSSGRNVAQGSTDDVTIPRIGAEYTVTLSDDLNLSLRAGFAHEPGHSMRIALFPDVDGNGRPDAGSTPTNITGPLPVSAAYASVFDGGSDQNHVTFGLGSTIGQHLSIDVAADLSPSNKYVTASLFYRF